MKHLYASWLHWKQAEETAQSERRHVEDQIRASAGLPDDLDGTKTIEADGYIVKVTGRIDRKVDADKLVELAAEAGLTEHLSSLFRWKPDINMSVWKHADESITRPLAGAITAKPGRPSFKIEPKETK
jgi:hypothetical protein